MCIFYRSLVKTGLFCLTLGMPTLFTKIISGDIPSYTIYEDEHTFAFLDIYPKQKGHTLVVPKIEVESFEDLDEPYAISLWKNSQYLAGVLKQVYATKKIGLLIEGLEVPHMHIHLIPIDMPGDMHGKAKSFSEEEMLLIQKEILNKIKE